MTYVKSLQDRLEELEKKLCFFISNIEIKEFRNDPYSGVTIVMHPYHYVTKINDSLKQQQINIKKKYTEWEEYFFLIVTHLPEDVKKEISDTTDFIKKQIELQSDWSTASTSEQNVEIIKKRFLGLYEIFNLFDKKESTILIPDTNSLIISPDFELYKSLLGNRITLLITSTVLSELDKLKIVHRDESFRKKVSSIIKRIKGFRNQGSLIEGITVHKTITVRMIANEPKFQNTLSWLDKDNNDDRIIATAIEHQINNPADSVYIVTSDINLQNKAEMAKIPYFETPEKV